MSRTANDNEATRAKPVDDTDVLAKLLELQQQTADQVADLRRSLKLQRAAKGPRKRRGPVVYSPPNHMTGPAPSDVQVAWARKLLRQYGWR